MVARATRPAVLALLAGGLRSSSGEYVVEYCCGLGRRLEPASTAGYLAIQPGGGLTVMASRRVGLRAQFDAQLAIPDQAAFEGVSVFPRVTVGAVIRLGR